MIVAVLTLILLLPAVLLAAEPATAADAIASLIDASRTGSALGIATSAVWLGTALAKRSPVLSRVPRRWRPVVPLVLGAAAAGLQAATQGASASQALAVGLSGPLAIGLHELLDGGPLGARHRAR